MEFIGIVFWELGKTTSNEEQVKGDVEVRCLCM